MMLLAEIGILSLMPRDVGATAFEIALSKYADGDDIITPLPPQAEALRKSLGYQVAQHYKYNEGERPKQRNQAKGQGKNAKLMMRKYHNHMTALEAKRELGGDIFDACFKVTLVANPYDRIVRAYVAATTKQKKPTPFAAWLRENPAVMNDNDAYYLIKGKAVIDHYLRVEHLDEDIATLIAQFPDLDGLADVLAQVECDDRPDLSRPDTAAHFDGHPDLVAAVATFNAEIVARFGYAP